MQNDDLASLLAQLRESQDPQFRPPVPAPAPPPPTQSELDSLLASLNARRSLSALTFPESLPLLQSLGASDAFLEALTDLRREQDELELMMRDERNRLEGEGKRGGISRHVQTQRLREWDRKALVRWTQLQDAQRLRLEELQVPTFTQTNDPIVLKRQERVMAVLVGFLDDV